MLKHMLTQTPSLPADLAPTAAKNTTNSGAGSNGVPRPQGPPPAPPSAGPAGVSASLGPGPRIQVQILGKTQTQKNTNTNTKHAFRSRILGRLFSVARYSVKIKFCSGTFFKRWRELTRRLAHKGFCIISSCHNS